MKKLNACIVIISSRQKCIKDCLLSLWEKYNHKYDYPVYVHYFDDIYDDQNFRDDIDSSCEQKVIFQSVPYKTPSFIDESEMFYNRKDLWYVNKSFPISRKGYLHMCNFTSNMYRYENTMIHNHDYVMTLDDESMFVKEMPYDPFQVMSERKESIGALKVTNQKLKKPHQGNFDTRVNLWKFIRGYIKHYDFIPKSKFIRDLLDDPDSETNFHFYTLFDSYVIKNSVFETREWKQWIGAVNKFGGIYKYRWGDNDIYALFYLLHMGDQVYDLKTVDDGYHSQGALRHRQDYAPGVKDNDR